MQSTTAERVNLDDVSVPKPELIQELYKWGIWGAFVVTLIWGFFPAEMNRVPELWTSSENMTSLIKEFVEPSFRYWRQYLELMLETVQMAVWGSFISVVAAVPFGLLSAENIAPNWIRFPVRRLMDSLRAINELVFALIFVSAVGLGPLAGVLALAVHTTGTLAKLFSEAVEAIDARPVEGIRATGANRLQEIVYGVIPQVLPLWISYSLYRFEANVRSATVLGIVGAGGIGMSLSEALRGFDFAAGSGILLIIIVTVSLLDIFSQYLRKVVIDGEEHRKLVTALDIVARGARIAVVGLYGAELTCDMNRVVEGGITVAGCAAFDSELNHAVELLGPLRDELSRMTTEGVGIDEVPDWYERLSSPDCRVQKVIIDRFE